MLIRRERLSKKNKNLLDILHNTLIWKKKKSFAEKFLTSTVQQCSLRPNCLQTYKPKQPAAPSTACLIRWKYCCCCYCCFISSLRKTTVTESRLNTMFICRIKQLLRSPLKLFFGSVALNQRADIVQPPAPHAPHRNSTWSQLQSDLDSKQMRCSGLTPDLVPHLLKGLLTPSTNYTFVLEKKFLCMSAWAICIDLLPLRDMIHHALCACTCMFPLNLCWGFL